ncbi:MAG: ApaG domain [Verrucomicrobiota bacterium]|jgi:ApaG protein
MNADESPIELAGLRVTVDRVVYRLMPFADKPHSFVYFITIHNDSPATVTITRRKWVITHADGRTEVLVGKGVVGQTPEVQPGETFSYNSQHFIPGPHATATGAYLGTTSDGRAVAVRIPPFRLVVAGGR